MSCARPGGNPAARGMIIGAQRCDGRHERRYPRLAPQSQLLSTAGLLKLGQYFIELSPDLRQLAFCRLRGSLDARSRLDQPL